MEFIIPISLILTGGTILASAVWTVATIKAESKAARETLDACAKQVGKLAGAIDRLDDKIDDHSVRLVRVETQINGQAG